MVARPGRPQAPFTSGELSPSLMEAKQLKYYRAGAQLMRNVEILPQGGFRQAPGLRTIGKVRKTLAAVSIASATLTAPNGGTATNIRDGDEATLLTTSAISGAGPVVLATITFGVATAVSAVDVAAFQATITGTIRVEYDSGGAVWVALNGSKDLKTARRDRRFASAPRAPITATAWRIAAYALSGSGTVSIGEVRFWVEGASYGNPRLRPFTAGDGSATDHNMIAGNVDVFASSWLASYALPHTDAAMPAVKTIQQVDTLLAFHQDVAPQRVLRQGADTEWQSAVATLINVPLYDYGGVYSNGTAAKWRMDYGTHVAGPNTPRTFKITVSGETTALITDPGTIAGVVTAVQTAIEALPSVQTGLTVTNPSGFNVDIEFTGAGNGGDGWVLAGFGINNPTTPLPFTKLIAGVGAGEDIMSTTRGWPRCGMFYQQALLLGGLKALPHTWLKSVTADYFNFNTSITAGNGAMVIPMAEVEGGEAIEQMIATRSPLLITSKAEYWLANRDISKGTNPPNHVQGERHGSTPLVQALECQGGAVFIDPERGGLYENRYNEVDQNMTTINLSILCSHLIDEVRDMAVQRASANNDANLVHLVKDDGDMAIMALLREHEIQAGSRRETDGDFLAVHVNGSNQVGVVTQRTVNAASVRFIERGEYDLLLDQAISGVNGPASATISGLADLEGQQVYAICDDDVLGPFTVAGGAISVGQITTIWTVGRWTAPRVDTLPMARDIAPGVVLERRGRIHTVRLSLFETTSIAVGANGGRIYDIPLFGFGDTLDVPALQHRFTGVVKIQGLTGYADQPHVTITQKRPGFMHVRGMVVEAAL